MVLKALAFEKRREPKDSYDLVYALRYAGQTPAHIAQKITAQERKTPAFNHAISVLKNRFSATDRDGPVRYEQFTSQPNSAAIAFAAVQAFLKEVASQ